MFAAVILQVTTNIHIRTKFGGHLEYIDITKVTTSPKKIPFYSSLYDFLDYRN